MTLLNKELHLGLLIAITITALYGCIIIYSASSVITQGGINLAYKQLFFVLLTLIVAFIIYLINMKYIAGLSLIFYIISLALLIVVIKSGKTSHGAQRWLSVGFLTIQPSEFAKIAIILALARYMSWNMDNNRKFRFIIVSCMIVFIPLALIIKQPDLGTSITLIPILTSMLFMAGIKKRYFLLLLPVALIPITIIILAKTNMQLPVIGTITIDHIRKMLFFLKTYQQNRLLVFIYPDIDPRGMSYNLIQSQIAIGSGAMFGNGFMAGTQTQLQFLPERHTDFIFSVLGEEWGFAGGAVLLFFYFLILRFGLDIADSCEDFFPKLAASGIVILLLFHIITNIGMTIGLMPITGVPLLLISYGGSSLLTTMVSMGLLLNFYANRNQTLFR